MGGQDGRAVFVLDAAHFAWLTLGFMMVLSRVAFQAAGPEAMRRFLDGWKRGRTRQVLGAAFLVIGAAFGVLMVLGWERLGWRGLVVVGPLVVVLVLDGLLNVVPSWFGHFKEIVQDRWVRHHGAGGGDRRLFLVGNLVLAGLSILVMWLVIRSYPVHLWLILGAVAAAIVLTLGLMVASIREAGGAS